MSGNGKASIMRPAGRSPPFVIIGLLILLCALGFKYWSLLGQQGELSKQCDEVRVELRGVYEKQMTAEKSATDLTAQLNAEKQSRDSLQKSIEEKDKKAAEQQGTIERLTKEVEAKKQESAQCDKERGDLRTEKQKLADEKQKLTDELSKLQKSPQCDRNACKDPIRELVGELSKTLGQEKLGQALSKVPFDLSSILGDVMQSAGNQNPGGQAAGGQQQQAQANQQKGKADAGGKQERILVPSNKGQEASQLKIGLSALKKRDETIFSRRETSKTRPGVTGAAKATTTVVTAPRKVTSRNGKEVLKKFPSVGNVDLKKLYQQRDTDSKFREGWKEGAKLTRQSSTVKLSTTIPLNAVKSRKGVPVRKDKLWSNDIGSQRKIVSCSWVKRWKWCAPGGEDFQLHPPCRKGCKLAMMSGQELPLNFVVILLTVHYTRSLHIWD